MSEIISVELGDLYLPFWVDGSREKPRRWLTITDDNVDHFLFDDYTEEVCTDLEVNPAQNGLDLTCVFNGII